MVQLWVFVHSGRLHSTGFTHTIQLVMKPSLPKYLAKRSKVCVWFCIDFCRTMAALTLIILFFKNVENFKKLKLKKFMDCVKVDMGNWQSWELTSRPCGLGQHGVDNPAM
jgi:hypothetical protein